MARQEQLAAEVARTRTPARTGTATTGSRYRRIQPCWRAWRTLWEPGGIDPSSPDVMLEWQRNHEAYVAARTQSSILADQVTRLSRAWEQFQQAVTTRTCRLPRAWADCLAELRRRVARGQAAGTRTTHSRSGTACQGSPLDPTRSGSGRSPTCSRTWHCHVAAPSGGFRVPSHVEYDDRRKSADAIARSEPRPGPSYVTRSVESSTCVRDLRPLSRP